MKRQSDFLAARAWLLVPTGWLVLGMLMGVAFGVSLDSRMMEKKAAGTYAVPQTQHLVPEEAAGERETSERTVQSARDELTETYTHSDYKYQFRYPDVFSVRHEDGGKVVIYRGVEPVVTLSVISRSEEELLLSRVASSVRQFMVIQDGLLDTIAAGQDVLGRGAEYESVGLEHFTGTAFSPGTPQSFGFTLTRLVLDDVDDIDGEDVTFVHLQNGEVLQIRQHRSSYVWEFDREMLDAIVQSVDPFVR